MVYCAKRQKKLHPHIYMKTLINNEIWAYSNDVRFICLIFPQDYSEKKKRMYSDDIYITRIFQ